MILERAFHFIQTRTMRSHNSSKIFIVPTTIGLYYFATAVIQLVMGVIFSNNLILLFGLMLLIFGILTAVITNFHLENVDVINIQASLGHENDYLVFTTTLINHLKDQSLPGINIDIVTNGDERFTVNTLTLDSNQNKVVTPFSLSRGKHYISHIILSSRYPLNLFQSWKSKRFENKDFYVFPKKIDLGKTSVESKLAEQEKGLKVSSTEYSHIDKYQQGEPFKRIDWKVYARTGELYKKVFQDHLNPQKHFILSTPITETKLSEISSLITDANEKGEYWELETEERIFPMNIGKQHYLEAQVYLSTRKSI